MENVAPLCEVLVDAEGQVEGSVQIIHLVHGDEVFLTSSDNQCRMHHLGPHFSPHLCCLRRLSFCSFAPGQIV